MESIDCVNESVNIFNEDIAFVEQYNFSQANLNESKCIFIIKKDFNADSLFKIV